MCYRCVVGVLVFQAFTEGVIASCRITDLFGRFGGVVR